MLLRGDAVQLLCAPSIPRSFPGQEAYETKQFSQFRSSPPPNPLKTRKMVVSLRLARLHLSRNNPSYKLVAIPSKLRVRARPLEILGYYSPIPVISPPDSVSPNGATRGAEWGPKQSESVRGKNQAVGEKRVEWNVERIKYWLLQGAVPSERVAKLLATANILGQFHFSPPCPRLVADAALDGVDAKVLAESLAPKAQSTGLISNRKVPSRTRKIRDAVSLIRPVSEVAP